MHRTGREGKGKGKEGRTHSLCSSGLSGRGAYSNPPPSPSAVIQESREEGGERER